MKFYQAKLLSLSVLALGACGESFDGPGESDLQEFLKLELPEGVLIDDIEIVAAKNEGDEIEPSYRTRSKVSLTLAEDFAEQIDIVGDRPVVKIVANKGSDIDAVIFTRSSPIGDDDWDIEGERVQIRTLKGQPLSSFGEYVVKGSPEEKAAREDQKRAQADEERAAAAKLAAAQKSFQGKWAAVQPLTRSGSVFSRNGTQIGISFDLGANDNGFGQGTGRVYNYANPSIFAESPITYVVRPDGTSAQITFTGMARHDDLPFYIASDSSWTLSGDGSVDGGAWDIMLKK